jgi:hypothetical protein
LKINYSLLKKTALIALISIFWILVVLKWKVMVVDLNILHDYPKKWSLTDYDVYRIAFDIIWKQQPIEWLYNCQILQDAIAVTETDIYKYPHVCYLYPPHFAVFLSWLSAFGDYGGNVIYALLSSVLFFIALILFTFMVVKKENKLGFFAIVGISAISYPVWIDVAYDNTNRIIFFLVAMTFYFHYYRKQSKWAGAFLGTAILFKITPAILFVFYFFKKKWKLLFGAILAMLIETIIVSYVVGWEIMWNYVTHIFWSFSGNMTENFKAPANSSLQGVFNYFGLVSLGKISFKIYVTILFICLLIWFRKERTQIQEIMLLSMLPLLFSPHLELNHMILAVLPTIILLNGIVEKVYKKGTIALIVMATFILVAGAHTIENFVLIMLLLFFTVAPVTMLQRKSSMQPMVLRKKAKDFTYQ